MPSPWPRERPFWYLRRRRDTVDAEISEEIGHHLEMRSAELQQRGLAAADARREAIRQFGDLEYTRRYCGQQHSAKERDMRRRLVIGDLIQDLRISLRGLLQAPVLALTIVTTVGLGIGATTVILAVIDVALLRPLPYANADRLVRIYTDSPPNRFHFSVADFLALQAQQTQFEEVAGFTDRAASFTDGQTADRIRGREVSWTYFRLLDITPQLGRDFTVADSLRGNPRAVIVSHGFWQRRLGGRADVLTQPLRLDGASYTVVGVLPPLNGPLERTPQFYLAAQWSTPPRKGPFFIIALGRLRPGAELQAADELHAINRRMFPLWRASYQDERATWAMEALKKTVSADTGPMAGLALAAVAFVWLIACTNASNLLMARVASRRKELAVRMALGASRTRVTGHLLAESALLASASAALGGAVAYGGLTLFRIYGTNYVVRTQELAVDGSVLLVLGALTSISVVMFGLMPSLHGNKAQLEETMRATGRSATGSRTVRRLRQALVGTQFAIVTPLLIGAALLLATLTELKRVDPGFDTRNILTGSIYLPPALYPDDSLAGFWTGLRDRVSALPGVAAVAYADGRPPDDVSNFNNFDLEAHPTPPDGSQPVTPWVGVTPEYFNLLGLTLFEGRLLERRDAEKENLEDVVVDRAWAQRFFPNESAIGKRFHEGGCTTCPWTTVVGVVGNVKYAGLHQADQGSVYWPLGDAARNRNLIVRTTIEPSAILPSVTRVMHELNPALPLSSVQTVDELMNASLEQPRSLSVLIGVLAAVALTLSLVGIYGVMANYVQQYAKDISIRLALGGRPADVLRLVVGQGMKVVAIGVIAGMAAAFFLARLMSTLLFGVTPTDAATFAGVAAVLLTVGVLACLIPARRATSLQPASVLRLE